MAAKIRLTIVLFFFASIALFAQKADDIIGKYRLPNKQDLEIFKSNGKYFGKIIAINGDKNSKAKDSKNPDKSKRQQFLIGKTIISGLKFDKEEKEWVNGSMYGSEKGMKFNLKITEIRENEIEVVGSKLFFWKTLVWKKL